MSFAAFEHIMRQGQGFVYENDLHPKHFINPANEPVVRELHHTSWDAGVTGFEYHTEFDNEHLIFHGWFIDRAAYKVCCTTPHEVLHSYPRGKALVSLLHNQSFAGVEAFAVACQNALGEDVDTVLFDIPKRERNHDLLKVYRTPGAASVCIARKQAA